MKVAKTLLVVVFYTPYVQALLNCRTKVSNGRLHSQLWASNTRKPFITGNWKMNPTTKQEAIELASGIAASVTPESPGDVAIFVPYPFIEAVQSVVGDRLLIGAEVIKDTPLHQNCYGLSLSIDICMIHYRLFLTTFFWTVFKKKHLGGHSAKEWSIYCWSIPNNAKEYECELVFGWSF